MAVLADSFSTRARQTSIGCSHFIEEAIHAYTGTEQEQVNGPETREVAYLSAMETVSRIFRRQSELQHLHRDATLLADDIEAALDAGADSVVLSHGGRDITALELERRASIFARWALRRGLVAGDRVAVALSPSADYVAVWIGLSKIGVCACLIPTHAQISDMIECVASCRAQAVIADPELARAWHTASTEDIPVYALAEDDTQGDIGPRIEGLADFRPDREHRQDLTPSDPALILFGSRSEGMRHPVTLDQTTAIALIRAVGRPSRLRPGKRILSMLPLYHHLAGLCGVGAALHTRATLILGSQFAVDSFWRQAQESGATGFLHSGEMCRHLMAAPAGPRERRHKMTEAIGTGMDSRLAAVLAKRTGIRKLTGIYTDGRGCVMMVGPGGRTGQIGKPVPFPVAQPEVRLARLDPASGACARDDAGHCIEVASGDYGEALVRAPDAHQQSNRPVLVNAFEPKDAWYRTGDIMARASNGRGFRLAGSLDQMWSQQGKTVFAQTIEEALLEFAGIAYVCAYGVSVPGRRGRSAMACIVPSGRSLDLAGLGQHMTATLPPEAVPHFVRLRARPLLGPTFFHLRTQLAAAGFDPSATSDPLYVNRSGVLGRLDEMIYARMRHNDLTQKTATP